MNINLCKPKASKNLLLSIYGSMCYISVQHAITGNNFYFDKSTFTIKSADK